MRSHKEENGDEVWTTSGLSHVPPFTLPEPLLSKALERAWHTLNVGLRGLRVKSLERSPVCGPGDVTASISVAVCIAAECYFLLIDVHPEHHWPIERNDGWTAL